MARTSFARTVVITHCDVRYVDENNNVNKTEIDLFGDYDIVTAQGAAKRALNAKGAIVENISHTSYYGRMSLQEFDKHCEKTNVKEW